MVVGSFASTFWGRPRMTQDADLVVEITAEKVAELEVYEIQEPYLEHDYLDRWAHTLGIADLFERVKQDAAHPPDG
jgi:hypothetical protein